MAELEPSTFVDDNLVEDGLAEVRKAYISSQGEGAEAFLGACYLNGIELWEAHRQRITSEIDVHGGVDNIAVSDYIHGSNVITCKDGEKFPATTIFQAPLVDLELNPNAPSFDAVKSEQRGFVRISFGTNIGIYALGGTYGIDSAPLRDKEGFEQVVKGKIQPNEVAITEGVITQSGFDNKITISGLMYTVRVLRWDAKLREEFAPDPFLQSEQYAEWLASEPVSMHHISFGATARVASRNNRYIMDNHDPDFGSLPSMPTYFDSHAMTRLTEDGANKMVRFGRLLNVLWRKEFGADMPLPSTSAGQTQRNTISQPSLPIGHITA